ncbi:hypothetical protein [Kitasatospora purpeofusca]|uniref:hypothetical protein n=1 Tax=Kitasatospora purpeofusca TaxID=67352 RepID=UPI00225B08D1|nr:hypothetical protein [Kitasatospora purpeofusca]MCX4754484.1 hypothetical protein [Kitasatospora purpeofusca]WSR33902.1 hypothetical protein OG715_24720 [Kitasatospora purpeofusca]WSR42118.1 hypothetical protein OG196_25230 [Kitasatospora purpeofusca]
MSTTASVTTASVTGAPAASTPAAGVGAVGPGRSTPGTTASTHRAASRRGVVRPDGTPRWAELAARATVWTTVPSGLWRLALGVGIPVGFSGELAAVFEDNTPGWGTAYLVTLSGLAEFLAFLTMGLVRPWGEVVPSWIPLIGGRAVRPLAAIVPAVIGSAVLTYLGASALFGGWADQLSDPEAPQGLAAVVMTLCYLPMVAWGPLVAAVTFAYARRTLGRRR